MQSNQLNTVSVPVPLADNAARRVSFGLVPESISSNEPPRQKENYLRPKHKSMIAGSFLETFEFQIPLELGPKEKKIRIRHLREACTPEYLENLARASDHRAISRIRTLICGNFDMKYVKFITLTFAPNLRFDTENLKICNTRKQTFIKKLLRVFPDLKYLIVPEYQKRGAVHYHMIADLPYLDGKWLDKTWGYGRTKIQAWISNRDSDSYHYITKELTKYVSKTYINHEFRGFRRFYASNSLVKPEKYYGEEAITLNKHCEHLGMKPIDDYELFIPYQGYVRYRSYRVRKHITLNDQDLIMGYVPEAYEH